MTVVRRLDLSRSADEGLVLVDDASSSATIFVSDAHNQCRLDTSLHSRKMLVLDVLLSPVIASLPDTICVIFSA